MKNKINIVFVFLLLIILIPQVTYASWWNPLTWKIFKKTPQQQSIQITTPNSSTKDDELTTENSEWSFSKNTNKSKSIEFLETLKKEKNTSDVKSKKDTFTQSDIDQYKSKATEIIELIQKDKTDFENLKKIMVEHKQKTTDTANDLFKKYSDLYDSASLSRSNTDKDYLMAGKKYVSSSLDEVLKKIEKYNSLIDFYTFNSVQNKDVSEVIESNINILKKCTGMSLEQWSKDSDCTMQSLEFATEDHTSNQKTLSDAQKSLKEIDTLSLNLIKSKLDSIDDDLTSRKESLSLSDQIQARGSNFTIPPYQAPVTAPKLTCTTTATGGIFNKEYKTTCLPETPRTPEQICASKKAHAAAIGSYTKVICD